MVAVKSSFHEVLIFWMKANIHVPGLSSREDYLSSLEIYLILSYLIQIFCLFSCLFFLNSVLYWNNLNKSFNCIPSYITAFIYLSGEGIWAGYSKNFPFGDKVEGIVSNVQWYIGEHIPRQNKIPGALSRIDTINKIKWDQAINKTLQVQRQIRGKNLRTVTGHKLDINKICDTFRRKKPWFLGIFIWNTAFKLLQLVTVIQN